MRFVLNPLAQITFSVTCGLMAPGVVQGFGSGLALAANVQHSQIARGKIFCKIFPQLPMKAKRPRARSKRLAAAVKQGRKSKGATLTPAPLLEPEILTSEFLRSLLLICVRLGIGAEGSTFPLLLTAAATAARSSVASRSTLGLWAHLFDCLLHILSAIPPISHRIKKCAFIKPQNLSLNITLS